MELTPEEQDNRQGKLDGLKKFFGPMSTDPFVFCMQNTQRIVGETAEANGFTKNMTTLEKEVTGFITLHSEISEAMEEHRKGNREALIEELADVQIRLLDLCYRLDIHTMPEAVVQKMRKNLDRPYKHGGKRY